MATKRKKGMTLAEHDALLKKEGQYEGMQALHRRQEEERTREAEEWRRAEAPLVEALKAVGVEVQSVWDLVNTSRPYTDAVPILLEHLEKSYPDRVKEGIARALAIPEAKIGWRILLRCFERDEDRAGLGAKAGLAVALAAAADDDKLEEVIALLRDARHGQNRVLLIDVLARSAAPLARSALMELRADPSLKGEVERALRRYRGAHQDT